jgi:hypothetical protein
MIRTRRPFIVCATVSLAAASCPGDLERRRSARLSVNALRAAVDQAARTAGSQTVDLSKLFPFDWDEVFIFPPYWSRDQIEGALGMSWEGAEDSTTIAQDHSVLFVFLARGRVVQFFDYLRQYGDFTSAARGEGLARTRARFRVAGDRKIVVDP